MPSFRLLRRAWPGRFDLTRRARRDAIVIFGAALVLLAAAIAYDIPQLLRQAVVTHAGWAVDDIILVALILGGAALAYSFRRHRDASAEIAARAAAERHALAIAHHDPLTGLPNRRYFRDKLGEHLVAVHDQHAVAVLLLNFNGLKNINDVYGQAAGDRALCAFATRIAETIGPGATFARVGGTEFAIVLPGIHSAKDAALLAHRIIALDAAPLLTDHTAIKAHVGIGIAVAPHDGIDHELLLRRADRALSHTKGTTQSSTRFYEADMDLHHERRMEIEREFRKDLEAAHSAITPHYQPLVAFEDNRIIGFEALCRWNNNVLGSVAPDTFIPIAEQTQLIGPLGERMLRQACIDAKEWPDDFILAFNISAVQLREPGFGLRVLSILGETGFDPCRLELEITETAVVDNTALIRQAVSELRQAGVRIALDDFGTGYATLSQLFAFDIDKIKIDKSFVARLEKRENGRVIIRAILSLARGFGLRTTAEGVEDGNQAGFLKESGCTEGQGFLYSAAVPASDIPDLLKKPTNSAAA